jgi:hypothetical protein
LRQLQQQRQQHSSAEHVQHTTAESQELPHQYHHTTQHRASVGHASAAAAAALAAEVAVEAALEMATASLAAHLVLALTQQLLQGQAASHSQFKLKAACLTLRQV